MSLRYDMMTYVQEVTVIRPGCSRSNVSAGQHGNGAEGHRATAPCRATLSKNRAEKGPVHHISVSLPW